MISPTTILSLFALLPGGTELPKQVELANKHLAVRFEDRGDGLRLAVVEDRARGEAYRFERSEEISLLSLPPSSIHDPDVAMRYTFQEGFELRAVDVVPDRAGMVLRFRHPMLDVQVAYELDPDVPELRKTTTCTAGARGAYVAAITHWMFKLDGPERSWPRKAALGQPAVFLTPHGGCFVTLEWPRSRIVSVEGDLRVAYRPGYALAPGETQQIAAGTIGFFGTSGGSEEQRIDDARQAFFRHVARRVKPQVPFPLKFTTWGPWLGQARADRILEVLDDLEYLGADLFHFDAGWQHPDYPYSKRLPQARDADDETWDRMMTQPERLPDGLLPIVREAKRRGMKVSLWFDACGNVFVREGEAWAIRDQDGEPVVSGMWEGRWPEAPRQSLASEYGDRLEEFVLQMLDRYDLGGVMFDNHHYTPDYSTEHACLANGFDSEDVQLRRILRIFEEVELAGKVRRSYETLFPAAPEALFEAAERGPLRVEIGPSPRDRRLAAQVLETIGAATGRRLTVDECASVAPGDAACRLIIGSIEGLAEHREIGDRFRRMLYNVYVAWDGKLYSAPLVAQLHAAGPPTYCLIAPRPEQLARLSIDLTARLLKGAKTLIEPAAPEPVWQAHSFELEVPPGRPALCFQPVVRQFGHVPLAGDLAMIRFQIEVEQSGKRRTIWAEEIPPFAAPGRGPVPTSFGGMQWWRDRVISIADLAGKRVRLHVSASPADGRPHPQLEIGYDRFSVVAFPDS
ncbi:MAG TPA: hypothetical protein VMY37_31735 [Thermoguttaceae bacterium]|nr:hypothetical protein [Thermoguttaceae bacterium]